jgi:hypothetical protein
MDTITPPRLGIASGILIALAACSNPNSLAPAQFTNVVDTTTLYALTGTPIGTPSAFDGVVALSVRTDLNQPFDFAVDLDGSGTWRVFPPGAMGYVKDGGILLSSQAFDVIATAPSSGYVQDTARVVTTGSVFVLRSRVSAAQCTISSSLPRYGKFHVIGVDSVARSITLEYLVNLNCGYRQLTPGIPSA